MNEIGRGKPTKTKMERLKTTSYLASWNAQGNMTTKLDLETFNEDMKGRKINICAIQETRNNKTIEIDIDGNILIFFGVQANGYGGLGFYISRAWGDADITEAQAHMNQLRIQINEPDELRRREAEAQLKRIMDARADRGRAIQDANQEFTERNTANSNGTRHAGGNGN